MSGVSSERRGAVDVVVVGLPRLDLILIVDPMHIIPNLFLLRVRA